MIKACHVSAERSSQLSQEKLLRSDLTGTSRLSGVLFVVLSCLSLSMGSTLCVHILQVVSVNVKHKIQTFLQEIQLFGIKVNVFVNL